MSSQYVHSLFPDDYKEEWQIPLSRQGFSPLRGKPIRLYLITLWIELFISTQVRFFLYYSLTLVPITLLYLGVSFLESSVTDVILGALLFITLIAKLLRENLGKKEADCMS